MTENMRIGITGTRQGMSSMQMLGCSLVLGKFDPEWVIHGAAIGVDTEAHSIAGSLRIRRHVWPSNMPDMTGDCPIESRDKIETPHYPLDRNHDIVDGSHVLLAFPNSREETLRSGTWATIRYALRVWKPTVIFYPTGRPKFEMKRFGDQVQGLEELMRVTLNSWRE